MVKICWIAECTFKHHITFIADKEYTFNHHISIHYPKIQSQIYPLGVSFNLEQYGLVDCMNPKRTSHYNDVIMGAITSQITSLMIVYSTVYSDADQRKHQSSASLAFMRGIHRLTVNSPHKCPVTRKMFPFDDVIMDIFITNQSTTQPQVRYLMRGINGEKLGSKMFECWKNIDNIKSM